MSDESGLNAGSAIEYIVAFPLGVAGGVWVFGQTGGYPLVERALMVALGIFLGYKMAVFGVMLAVLVVLTVLTAGAILFRVTFGGYRRVDNYFRQ